MLLPPWAVLVFIFTAATVTLGLFLFKTAGHVTSAVVSTLLLALVSATRGVGVSTIWLLLARSITGRLFAGSVTRRFLARAVTTSGVRITTICVLLASVGRLLLVLVSTFFTITARLPLTATALALLPAVLLLAGPGSGTGFAPPILAGTCTTPVSIVGVFVTTPVFLVFLLLLFFALLALLLHALLIRIATIIRIVIVIGVFLGWLTASSNIC
jgi:hypothetical protein